MGRFLAFLLGIAGAVIGSQGPGFTLQYMQNLQGQITSLEKAVGEFDANIAQYGYTRARALDECRSADGLLDALCGGYVAQVERYELLTAHMAELEAVSDTVRPLILARKQMPDITNSAYKQFKPAVPATIDGVIYAGGGFALLWGGASFLFWLLGGMFGARRYA
ncbi:DUF2937 family protein [Hyphococcus luteus]|uniref:DUF2937 domain-containing protein n=1 Tax=Hyphococcus luteus TaxID=2058213 RepID=A0A2S7K7D2_9PROT|nr:DUF2937 family protein [Marinicaulis flavus]PQA88396.1 hypothetical protein CW354_08860 [Marinicaulis flavus]